MEFAIMDLSDEAEKVTEEPAMWDRIVAELGDPTRYDRSPSYDHLLENLDKYQAEGVESEVEEKVTSEDDSNGSSGSVDSGSEDDSV